MDGNELRQMRLGLGMSQVDVARLIGDGVSQKNVSEMELGKRSVPSNVAELLGSANIKKRVTRKKKRKTKRTSSKRRTQSSGTETFLTNLMASNLNDSDKLRIIKSMVL